MLKNYLLNPLCSTSAPHLSLFQLSFSFSFSASLFCFSLLVSASFFCFFSSGQRLFLLLFSSPSTPLFFFLFFNFFPLSLKPLSSFLLDMLPFFYQPKTFFTSAQNHFLAQKRFCFSPRYFFSSAQKSLPVCGSVPPFCFFSSRLSFLPLATTYCPFSAQVFSSKPFSAASCLFI